MSGVNEYDTTPGNNGTINSINIAEGCAPSGINNALRQLMSDIKAVETVQTSGSTDTVVKADYGNLMEYTATVTVNMTAVATLGDNWYCYVWANGGTVTIDGDGSETINGATTLVLGDSSWARVWCDGTELHAVVGSGNLNDIKQDLIPNADGAYDLGSATKKWAEVHADTYNGGGFGFRNLLINPLARVDIEGNASGVTANGEHVVEGWRGSFSTDVTTITVSRIAGETVPYALQMEITTGSDASLASNQFLSFYTAVEGYDFAPALWGTSDAKDVVFSVMAKASVAGTYTLGFINGDQDRSYVADVALTSTLQRITVTVPGDTSGTWNSTNGVGLGVRICAGSGTDFQGTNETWEAAHDFATSNTVNMAATNGATLTIEDPTLGIGGFCPSETIPFDLELHRCYRYYETSYDYGTAPGASTSNGLAWGEKMADGASRLWMGGTEYKAAKRNTPTVTIYTQTGTSGYINEYNNTSNTLQMTGLAGSSTRRHVGRYMNTATPSASETYMYHWESDARLI